MNYHYTYAKGPNGALTLPLGAVTAEIIGGPYAYAAARPEVADFRVKLAPEVKGSSELVLPIKDFSTPDPAQAHDAVIWTLRQLMAGNRVYVGCMGGFGRTGLFLALLTKVAMEYERKFGANDDWAYEDPVEYVRRHYVRQAVETKGQEDFVDQFHASTAARLIRHLQPVPAPLWIRVRAYLRGMSRRLTGVLTRATGA